MLIQRVWIHQRPCLWKVSHPLTVLLKLIITIVVYLLNIEMIIVLILLNATRNESPVPSFDVDPMLILCCATIKFLFTVNIYYKFYNILTADL